MNKVNGKSPQTQATVAESTAASEPPKVHPKLGNVTVGSPVRYTARLGPRPPHTNILDRDARSIVSHSPHENRDSGYSTMESSSVSDLSPASTTFPPNPEEQHQVLLQEALKVTKGEFDTRLFLSGLGKAQVEQIEILADWLIDQIYDLPPAPMNQQLRALLSAIKAADEDKTAPPEMRDFSFALRSALILASEKTGAGLQSWEAYTRQPPGGQPLTPENDNFWPWVEQTSSWVPEAQASFLKYTETAFVKALKLSESHPEAEVVAYKGGFGAGKTSHGIASYGVDDENQPLFDGSVAPDSAKKNIRKVMPLSHGSVHLQSSNMAFNLFDGLIRHKALGTIIYDTSLSRAKDIKNMINKSVAAGKPFKVVDIARDDTARMLAVLAREIDGEDPRVPVSFLLAGAERDRKGRAECMNAILDSNKTLHKNKKTGVTRQLTHSMEFNCCSPDGSDRQKIVTLRSSEPPEWNQSMSLQERTRRLHSQGITFNTQSQRFENITADEDWQGQMKSTLQRPVSELLGGLSEQEAQKRTEQFNKRFLSFNLPMADMTPEAAYDALAVDLQIAIPKEAFLEVFKLLEPDVKAQLLADFYRASGVMNNITYIDLPAIFALEFNRYLMTVPESWKEPGSLGK